MEETVTVVLKQDWKNTPYARECADGRWTYGSPGVGHIWVFEYEGRPDRLLDIDWRAAMKLPPDGIDHFIFRDDLIPSYDDKSCEYRLGTAHAVIVHTPEVTDPGDDYDLTVREATTDLIITGPSVVDIIKLKDLIDRGFIEPVTGPPAMSEEQANSLAMRGLA